MTSAISSASSQSATSALQRLQAATSSKVSGQFQPPDPATVFKSMDTNSDGKVSKDEFTAALDQMKKNAPPGGFPGGFQPPSAEDLFNQADTSGDGSVSIDELKSSFEAQKQKAMQALGGQGAGGGDISQLLSSLGTDSSSKTSDDPLAVFLKELSKVKDNKQGPTYGNSDSSSSSASGTVVNVQA